MEPTHTPFNITMSQLPHGFMPVSVEDIEWFGQMINSDIRYFYRTLRDNKTIVTHNPIGRSGITAGELALYIIRENHTKRQKRY